MKNTFTLIMFMLLFSMPVFAQLDEEGFEGTWTAQTGTGPGGPADWAIINVLPHGPVQNWLQGNGGPTTPVYEGTYSACILGENVANGSTSEDWLITKAFTVPANAELHFFSRLGVPGDQNTQYKVMMSANTAAGEQTNMANYAAVQTWTELQLNPSQLEWTEKVINIPATYPAGTQVFLAFVMQGDAGDRWAIDNVKVVSRCLEPTTLTAVPSNTSANLSWGNPSGATEWEIEVVPAAGSPTGVGVTYDGALPYTAPGLTASTAYKYYVRALCDDNTSAWVGPFNFTTTVCPIEDTCNYIFTVWDTFGDGWNGNTMTVSQNGVTMATLTHTASGTAPVNINVPLCDGQPFQLFWNSGGSWATEVGVTVQNNFGQALYTKNPGSGSQNSVLYNGNVNCDTPECLPVSGLTVTNPTQNSATLNWAGPNTGDWQYYVVPNGTPAPTAATAGTATTTKPVTVTSTTAGTPFAASTTYQYYVRIACSGNTYSAWAGPYTFTTTQVPATLNYSQPFDTGANDWALVNGSQTNKWVVGSAVSNSAANSLYVSNNDGAAHAYTITSASVVHAYRDIFIPAGTAEINLSFDWRNNGQSAQDYMRVWMAPVSYTPVAGTQTTLALAGGATVATQVGGNFQLNDAWTNFNYTANVSNYGGTIRRVIFEWRNNATTGNQAPAAVDNININIVTCPQPLALTAGGITSTTAVLGWTNQGTADEWEVYVVPTGTAAPTPDTEGEITEDNPYTAGPLTPSTTYQYYVRAVCGDDDKSVWSGPYSFTTSIANDNCEGAMVLPVNPGEECVENVTAVFTSATASATPACTGINGPDIWYTFTAEGPRHNIAADFSNMSAPAMENNTQPITLSMYAGNVCTALDAPLYCVTNNYIVAANLTPGNVYTVRVTISSNTPNLNYPFTLCVTTPEISGGSASACEITTINYSFESPNLLPTQQYPPQVNQNVVPGWKTTATDGRIEVWRVSAPGAPFFEVVEGYDGDQFVELNATQPSALYQDYTTPPGTVFSYGFAHRGRMGTDVCQVMAGPPGGPYVNVGPPVSTGNTAWSYNTGTYTVPEGQTVTRFLFQAVSTAATGANALSTGNFLDAVTFTANVGIITNSPVALDCENNTALIEANGTGTWVAHSGNPSPTVIEDDQSNVTTVSGFTVPGSYYYEWSTALCSSTLEIIYDAEAISEPVVVDVTYCQGDIPAQLTATASGSNTLHWFTEATGGTELTEAPTPSTETVGTTTYYVSQSFFNCESPRAEITVTVNPLPAAPVATDIEYCQNATAVPLTATAETGSTLVWYTVANGGTALTEAPTPSTAATGTTVYYVSQENAQGCESARTAITVTINPLINPETGFTLPATVCEIGGTVSPTLNPGFITGGTFTADSADLSIDAANGTIDLAASEPGTYVVTYTIAADAANCITADSSQATIIITEAVTPVVGFTYTDVCGDAANQTPATATGFTTGGTFSAAAGLDINPATGEINVANSTPNTYTVTYTLAENAAACAAAATATATIVITPVFTPVAEFNYNDNYCFNQGTVTPALAGNFTAGGTFTASNGLAINPATGEINVNTATPGIYTVTYTVAPDASICSAGNTYTDTFSIGGEIAFTLEGNCEVTDYFIRAESATNGGEFADGLVFEWYTADGTPAGGNDDFLNVSEFALLNPGQVFPIQFVLTVSDGVCENSVVFEVPDIACMVQRGISPNGDEFNQTFDLTSMGVRKLVIFNRYGTEVYSRSNYANEWYGQTNSGDELPSGTYYYMFERNTGETRTGWIYINREE
jgi:large repetitive protein